MSEMTQMLVDTASRQFKDLCIRKLFEDAEKGIWPEDLWKALEQSGLAMAATSEERGGSGADLSDVAALIKCGGYYAAPVPLAETLLAEYLLAAAKIPCLSGPVSVGPIRRGDRVTVRKGSKGEWLLTGKMHRVPWGRHAKALVLLADGPSGVMVAVVERPTVMTEGKNYAGEPRDSFRFDNDALPASAAAECSGLGYDWLFSRGALFRAVAMAGALEKVLEGTVQYAKDRVQFGRPIGKFQAVQQQIAVLASQVAAASAAAQAASDAAMDAPALFEIAAAKARVGEAAGIAAAIAHQVHGAIGFTQEHSLQLSTRRLWSWRDEFGSESECMAWIGEIVARVGGEGLWPFLTQPEAHFSGKQDFLSPESGKR